MDLYQNILVFEDKQDHHHIALKRGVDLAKYTGGTVHYVRVVHNGRLELKGKISATRDHEKAEIVEAHKQRMQHHVEQLNLDSSENVVIAIEVLWDSQEFDAICAYVEQSNIDILIKASHKYNVIKDLLFTDLDFQLMRDCPSQVLLVKDHEWRAEGHIVSAIELEEPTMVHQGFNRKLQMQTRNIANMVNAHVHFVSCYKDNDIDIQVEDRSGVNQEDIESIKTHVLQQPLERLREGNEEVHLIEGDPEYHIPKLVQQLSADLVVVGAGEHKGWLANLRGHTSELLSQSLECDLLAIKP